MEQVFHHTIYDNVVCDPSERPLLITNHHINKDDKAQSERLVQYIFETFFTPSCYIARPTSLAAFRVGKPTCAVIDCGEGVTDICCLYEGCGITRIVNVVEIAGSNISKFISQECEKPRVSYPRAREIKEKLACIPVNLSFDVEKKEGDSDGQFKVLIPNKDEDIDLSPKYLRCQGMLFNPRSYGFDFDGIGQALFNSIMLCDEEIRKEMFSNIVLSGGTTMCPGFFGRLGAEITRLAPPGTDVRIIAPPERDLVVWRGGSMLAVSDLFSEMAITQFEYDEVGTSIVHRKCW